MASSPARWRLHIDQPMPSCPGFRACSSSLASCHPPFLLLLHSYAAAACDDADGDYLSEGLQIVGMSATLPNVDKVAK